MTNNIEQSERWRYYDESPPSPVTEYEGAVRRCIFILEDAINGLLDDHYSECDVKNGQEALEKLKLVLSGDSDD